MTPRKGLELDDKIFDMELTKLALVEFGKQSTHGPMQSGTPRHGKTFDTIGSTGNEILKRALQTCSNKFQVAERVKLGLQLKLKVKKQAQIKINQPEWQRDFDNSAYRVYLEALFDNHVIYDNSRSKNA